MAQIEPLRREQVPELDEAFVAVEAKLGMATDLEQIPLDLAGEHLAETDRKPGKHGDGEPGRTT